MINTTLLNPPGIGITDGKLETRNTRLDGVSLDGDSAIEAQNTEIDFLQLWDYSWAFVENSTIGILDAWNGDFNIELENTTARDVSTHNTAGLNFKTKASDIKYLFLDAAQPNTPQNVELQDTRIGTLALSMLSPQPIQCSDVTLGNLTLKSGWEENPPITITGTIDFTPEASIIQNVKDGYTRIRRVYLINATINDDPAAEKELFIHLSNHTKTVTTNQQGQAVVPVTYLRHYLVISNPQPGGPYMINFDNLTTPFTVSLGNQYFNMSLISDTPFKIEATQGSGVERWIKDWQHYAPWTLLLTAIAIALYIYSSRPENPA